MVLLIASEAMIGAAHDYGFGAVSRFEEFGFGAVSRFEEFANLPHSSTHQIPPPHTSWLLTGLSLLPPAKR